MPERQPDRYPLEPIVLSDFTPGIFSAWHAASGPQAAPDGAAQADSTYSCVGLPTGGLVAGPRITASYHENLFDAGGTFPTSEKRMAVLAFRNLSPVLFTAKEFNSSALGPGNYGQYGARPDQLYVVFEHFADIAGASAYKMNFRAMAYKFQAAHVQSTVIHAREDSDTVASRYYYGNGNIVIGRTARQGFGTATVGRPTVALAMFPARAVDEGIYTELIITPEGGFDPNAQHHDSSFALPAINGNHTTGLLAHQSRLVAIQGVAAEDSAMGLGGTVLNEKLQFTPANDWFSDAALSSALLDGENPSGIGLIASMNASEMIVIKRVGGGVVARGDLLNPTIVRLPGLPSIYDTPNIPAVSPIGLVYGNPFGVWAWAGGDTAELLSPQLDGWFWNPGGITSQFTGNRGSFAYMHPFIFAPNNYIFDTRTRAWWRYGVPSVRTYTWHSPSANGQMLCGPASINDPSSALVDWFDTRLGAPEFQWESQPLAITRGRVVDIRDILLVAQGTGTITITITGISGEPPATKTFTVNSTDPVAQRARVAIQGHDLVVKINSEAPLTSGTAPSILRLELLPKERAQVPAT